MGGWAHCDGIAYKRQFAVREGYQMGYRCGLGLEPSCVLDAMTRTFAVDRTRLELVTSRV
jgi:hypothetical protein